MTFEVNYDIGFGILNEFIVERIFLLKWSINKEIRL